MPEAHLPNRIDHDIPVTPAIRLMLALAGLAVLVIPAWQLRQGLWPLNGFSPLVALIVLGTWLIAAVFLGAALVSASSRWAISPGQMRVTVQRPFRPANTHTLTSADRVTFEVRQLDWVESQDTWQVMLLAPDGKSYGSAQFRSPEAAEAFRSAGESLFRSKR